MRSRLDGADPPRRLVGIRAASFGPVGRAQRLGHRTEPAVDQGEHGFEARARLRGSAIGPSRRIERPQTARIGGIFELDLHSERRVSGRRRRSDSTCVAVDHGAGMLGPGQHPVARERVA